MSFHFIKAPLSGLFDKISGQIERHLIAISGRLRPANDPMCQSLRCLIDAVHLAKTSRDTNVANNIITIMVRSFLEHYRPSFWRDQPRGLETMEHLKEAHMLTLRHMLSLEQTPFGYAWVTRQVCLQQTNYSVIELFYVILVLTFIFISSIFIAFMYVVLSQVTHTWIHLDGGNVSGSGGVNQGVTSLSNTSGNTADDLQNQELDLNIAPTENKTSSLDDMVDTTATNNWTVGGGSWKQVC